MKAIRKSDGKIIEVKPYCPPQEDYDNYKCYPFEDYYITSDNEVLSNYDLDFNVEEAEQTESAVVSGWVARDEDGFISLFNDKPTRDYCDKNDIPYGFWDEANGHHLELPITSFPSLTWESDPLPVTITIKPKKQ